MQYAEPLQQAVHILALKPSIPENYAVTRVAV